MNKLFLAPLLLLLLVPLIPVQPNSEEGEPLPSYIIHYSAPDNMYHQVRVELDFDNGVVSANEVFSVQVGADDYAVSRDGQLFAMTNMTENGILVWTTLSSSTYLIEGADEPFNLNVTSEHEIVVEYQSQGDFVPDTAVWIALNNDDVLEEVYRRVYPDWMCWTIEIQNRDLLLRCNDGSYVMMEDQTPFKLDVESLLYPQFCGDASVCIAIDDPEHDPIEYSFVRYDIYEDSFETIVSEFDYPVFELWDEDLLVYFSGQGMRIYDGDTNPVIGDVLMARSVDDYIFWTDIDYDFVDLRGALHVYNNGVSIQVPGVEYARVILAVQELAG